MQVVLMDKYDVVVKVPASTANLGSGFDTIGMALQLYTTIRMRKASSTSIHMRGYNLDGIPTGKDNLIYKVAKMIFEQANLSIPELEIEVESEIPLTRGLGSSAAAIVGGLVAANTLAGQPFDREEIYEIATTIEGHPDNVGASLLGGIIIATWDGTKISYIRVNPPVGLKVVVAIPNFELSTEVARNVLPSTYSREDTIHALSHSALLAGALASGNTSVLYKAMHDRVHQPYRMPLIPGLEKLLASSEDYGALGIALSGAGPTIIALTEQDNVKLTKYMSKVLQEHGVSATIDTLYPDTNGVCIQTVNCNVAYER
jgi:homoserine kinase